MNRLLGRIACTQCIDAAYCYIRRTSVVYVCVEELYMETLC